MAIIGLAAGVQGYYFSVLSIFERVLMLIVPFLLIEPNIITDVIGLVILVSVYLLQRRKAAKHAKEKLFQTLHNLKGGVISSWRISSSSPSCPPRRQ